MQLRGSSATRLAYILTHYHKASRAGSLSSAQLPALVKPRGATMKNLGEFFAAHNIIIRKIKRQMALTVVS